MKTTSYSFPVAVTILLGLVFSLTGCGGSSVPTTDNSGTVRDSSVENKLPAAGEPIAGMVSGGATPDQTASRRYSEAVAVLAKKRPTKETTYRDVPAKTPNRRGEVRDGDFYIQFEERTFRSLGQLAELVFRDNSDGFVFPGSLLWTRPLIEGRFVPPPTTEYRPVVNSVIAGGTSNVKLTDSKTQGPTFTHNGTFLDFQRQSDPILKQIDRTARKLSIDFGYGKSLGSALLNVGVSAGFWNSSLSAGLSNSSLKQRSFAVLSLSEVFYTIVADMPNAHGYFPPAILDNDRYLAPLVLNKMTEYGEIGYVRSVKYGRRVMIAVSANATEEELRRSLNLDADALVIKFKGGVDDQTRKVWETMDAKVVVIGGKITPALADCVTGGPTNFLHSVNRYLKDTAVFDAQTGPVPVSFEMRYAHDNEPMINYETLEFAGQIVTGRKRAEETIRLTKAVELTATDARLVHEDPEIDTDDWTKVDVRYSLALSSNSRAVDLALTMNAFECESDRRYNWETHIRTAKTIGLYKLANDDPRVILSIDAVSRSDFREEMFGGRLHDWFSFPSFGALREITVHVDGSTGNDVREQGLKAELDLVIKVDRER